SRCHSQCAPRCFSSQTPSKRGPIVGQSYSSRTGTDPPENHPGRRTLLPLEYPKRGSFSADRTHSSSGLHRRLGCPLPTAALYSELSPWLPSKCPARRLQNTSYACPAPP